MIGQTLDGRYAIRSRIARGGMAMVYLANDLRLERRVAVKVMHLHLAEEENFTRRFEQEARSAARLSHPNLVNVFDQGHDQGRTYLVMEYLPSITLRDLLKRQKLLSTDEALEIGEAVLSGLAAAHRAGIVHRDLKPENVLLADDGRIKLGDFGLARAVSANTTTGQALLGTIAYLSPELVTRGVADARSDLYAFGIMMYEMLTGEQPFTGEQPMQIAYQHAHSEVPVPSLISDQATPELDELVRWTTQRDPELRPADAGEALDYLSPLRQGLVPPNATRVLPTGVLDGSSPETTVLPGQGGQWPSPSDADHAHQEPPGVSDASQRQAPPAPIDRAASAASRRRRRGLVAALLVIVLVGLAGGTGWWFGQGPGSRVSVPDISGSEMADARAALEERTLVVEQTKCPSLDVAAGLAVSTEPEAGTRVDRGSAVRLCESTGPRLLDVPTFVGKPLGEAEGIIEGARFTVGEVLEKRFSDAEPDVVIAALGENGDSLGDTYPEQGRIDLILSAGPLPGVSGMSVKQATEELERRGLKVDPGLATEEYNDEVPKGDVLSLITNTDPVRPGDSVGLHTSLGPELFEIPDVSGKGLQEAMDMIASAGFKPSTLVPDALRQFAKATGTDPAAGELVPAGTEIRVKSTISL